MHNPDTPTDDAFRRRLTPAQPGFLEDWDTLSLEAQQVDWLGWQPAQDETLFTEGAPESLFLDTVLKHDRQAAQWRRIVGGAYTTWLHALIDVANEHPKSPGLRQAMNRLVGLVVQDGKLEASTWGHDGVAERVLIHLKQHPRKTARGEPEPLPRELLQIIRKSTENGDAQTRLTACGQSYPNEERSLIGLKLGIGNKTRAPKKAGATGAGYRNAPSKKLQAVLDLLRNDLAEGQAAEVYNPYVGVGDRGPVYTIALVLGDQATPEMFSAYLDTTEKCQKLHLDNPPGEGADRARGYSPLWLAGHYFLENSPGKLQYLLDQGAKPTKREGRELETVLHKIVACDRSSGTMFDSAQIEACQRVMAADPSTVLLVDRSKMTPLMRAIRKGKASLCAWLMEHGSSQQLQLRDRLGHGVAHAILQSFPPETAKPLLKQLNARLKIDWTQQSVLGETAAQQVARRPEEEKDDWAKLLTGFGVALDDTHHPIDGFRIHPPTGRIMVQAGLIKQLQDSEKEGHVLIEDDALRTLVERTQAQARDRKMTWRPRAPRR
jgi:hypothetical protein